MSKSEHIDSLRVESDSDVGREQAQDQVWKAGRQELLIIYSLALMSLMVALDASVVVTALPSISSALHATSTQSFWIGTAYVLPNTVSQLVIANLSHTFGRRELYIPSIALFAIGSVVAATAHTIATLLSGRVIQGIGGGGLTAMTLVVITDIIPLRHRPKYIAINSAAWAIGTIVGPIIGGALSSSWRWIFYMMLPFCGLGLVITPFILRFQHRPTTPRTLTQKFSQIDYPGFALFISSLTTLLIALSWGGSTYSWTHPATLVPLIISPILLILTILYETHYSHRPFILSTLFTHRPTQALTAYPSATLQGATLFATLYTLPLFFASTKSHSPTRTGIDLLPLLTSFVPASIAAGILSSKTGNFTWSITPGWILTTLSVGLFITFNAHTPTAVWVIIELLLGTGQGLVLTGLSTATQASCQPEDAASAGAMYTFSRQLGSSIGIPLVTATWQNFMAGSLERNGLDTAIARDAVGYVGVLQRLPESAGKTGVVDAYVAGWRGTYYVFTGLAGLGLILSVFVRGLSMEQGLKSEYVLERSGEQRKAQSKEEAEQVLESRSNQIDRQV